MLRLVLLLGITLVAQAQVRLGLDLEPLEPELSKLVGLPAGVGFEVTGVAEGGPGDNAGVSSGDVLKSIDGQILINREQLSTLLKMFSPGASVEIATLRSGVDLKRTLRFSNSEKEVAEAPIDLDQRVVRVATDEGRAELSKDEEVLSLSVVDRLGKEIFLGPVHTEEGLRKVPQPWRDKVPQMIQVLRTYRMESTESTGN